MRRSCYSAPRCIAIIDLDHFKKINDCFGHPLGDEVLRAFAISVFAIRTIDRFGRQGGEELLLILPDTDIDRAIQTEDILARADRALWDQGRGRNRVVATPQRRQFG